MLKKMSICDLPKTLKIVILSKLSLLELYKFSLIGPECYLTKDLLFAYLTNGFRDRQVMSKEFWILSKPDPVTYSKWFEILLKAGLLDRHGQPTANGKNFNALLTFGVDNGYINLVLYVLKTYKRYFRPRDINFLLESAVEQKQRDLIQSLYDAGIKFDLNPHGGLKKEIPNPLLSVITSGDNDYVKFLIQYGFFDPLESGQYLYYAITSGSFDIVQTLVENHANVNDRTSPSLELAVAYGDRKIIDYLIQHGAKTTNEIMNDI